MSIHRYNYGNNAFIYILFLWLTTGEVGQILDGHYDKFKAGGENHKKIEC